MIKINKHHVIGVITIPLMIAALTVPCYLHGARTIARPSADVCGMVPNKGCARCAAAASALQDGDVLIGVFRLLGF